MKQIYTIFLSFFLSSICFAQVDASSELYKSIRANDSLLFTIGFNQCDIQQFENLLSDNFEFYHDINGITNTKEAFLLGIKNGLCQLDYKAKRVLVEGSLEVYPLKNNGVLYGAIQTGIHHFFAIEKDNSERLTSIAKFNHLWLLENGQWKLSNGLSYDHKDVDKP